VAQVVTFGIPHGKLGEEVGAAVVLREGETLTEHALRDFAGERLAPFKVPRRIVFLSEIPKGATGKLQRIGLAEKLGLSA
jgi:acyl-CoA synthetase (AMP-forming)/AMP-acid ligase II